MDQDTQDLVKVIKIDEGKIRDHVGEIVRGSVEETLNALLDAEADRLCQAKRYERTTSRKDTRLTFRTSPQRYLGNFRPVDQGWVR